MSRYLLKVDETYRVDLEDEVNVLIEEMKEDSSFELIGYGSTKKTTKDDEYFVVKIKKQYNNEKNPAL